jgi:hypothetical protein
MANQAVYGIVNNRNNAERLIQALIDAGVNPQDISILSSQSKDFKEFSSTDASSMGRNWRTEERITDYPAGTKPKGQFQSNASHKDESRTRGDLGTEKRTKMPEGAATGGLTGGIIGGTLGLLAGIGALAIPGLGPFIAAGPLMAALSGIGAGGTIGGIIGALAGAGIPEYEAKRYENRLKEGGILIAVRANNDNLAKRIKEIFNQHGAEDVSISSEASMPKNYNKNK